MQAAQAANRICLAITLPKSKCDVSPKHGLNQVTSLPNLVTTGRNLGQIRPSWPGSSRNPFRLPEQPVPSRFRDPEQGATGATKPFRRTREVFRKHWPLTLWSM